MHILLTNDDGCQAPGLGTLIDAVRPLATWLSVVAPLENQSGTGHQITYRKPLIVSPMDADGADAAFAVDGTPCDCVRLAIGGLFPEPPDLVIAGVNHGANLGHDVHYSGTVSAAVESASAYIAAIAVSREQQHFDRHVAFADHAEVAAYLTDLLGRLIAASDVPATGNADPLLLNVNLPARHPSELEGVRYTIHAGSFDAQSFEARESPQGIVYYWPHRNPGKHVHDHIPSGLSDTESVAQGYVSVTPLHANRTNRDMLDELHRRVPPSALHPHSPDTSAVKP